MDQAELAKLLLDFIADEDFALANKLQGSFWPSNHYLIQPAVGKAEKCLELADQERFYFHFMRVSGDVPVISEKAFPRVTAAYGKLFSQKEDGSLSLAKPYKILFCFGFDEKGVLPEGVTQSASELKLRVQMLKRIEKYAYCPSQRTQVEKIQPYANYGECILHTLRHVGYRNSRGRWHDPVTGEESYIVRDTLFWWMVLIALMNESARTHLVRDMLDGDYDFPHKDQHLTILHQTVQLVLPNSKDEDDDIEFYELAKHLGLLKKKRCNATESMAFARALSLPFEKDEDWSISISIPQRDCETWAFMKSHITLQINSNPDSEWHLYLLDKADRRFKEYAGEIVRNDLNLTGLGKGNLAAFPEWVRRIDETSGLSFSIEHAVIRCGSKRAVIKLIALWLGAK